MNCLREITKLLYQIGDKDDRYVLYLPDVYINYGLTNVNLFIENKKVFLLTESGYKYRLTELTNFENFSILYSIEKYVKEMLKT